MVAATTQLELPPDESDDEEIREPLSWWQRLGRGLLALVALVSFLYLSGIHQYFLLQRTSPEIEQTAITRILDAPQIEVPLTVFILRSEAVGGSTRSIEDTERIIANSNRIWEQAQVRFVTAESRIHEVTARDLQALSDNPRSSVAVLPGYDPARVTVVFVGILSGVNGIAYIGSDLVMVADFTSAFDFRTLAHEFGHVLGLGHVPTRNRLMSTGADGVELTLEEIERARSLAERFTY